MCLLAYPRVLQKLEFFHCVDSRKQHEAINTDKTNCIIHNYIRNIDLNIGKYISDNDNGEIYTIEKMHNVDIILLNVKVIVILFIILII